MIREFVVYEPVFYEGDVKLTLVETNGKVSGYWFDSLGIRVWIDIQIAAEIATAIIKNESVRAEREGLY